MTSPVDSAMYCCFTREPSGASMLNRTSAPLSVAEYSLTGMVTRPKDNDSDAIERAGICFSSRAGTGASAQHGRLPESGSFRCDTYLRAAVFKAYHCGSLVCCGLTATSIRSLRAGLQQARDNRIEHRKIETCLQL